MIASELKKRTKQFGIQIVKLVESLRRNASCSVIGRPLLRAGTPVGANYRAVCRVKSRADFIAKMTVVEEECDESLYWIETLIETGHIQSALVANLLKAGDELLVIEVAPARTARGRENPKSQIPNPK